MARLGGVGTGGLGLSEPCHLDGQHLGQPRTAFLVVRGAVSQERGPNPTACAAFSGKGTAVRSSVSIRERIRSV